MAKFIRCPNCQRVKFIVVATNETIWIKLNSKEELALDIAFESQPLLVILGGLCESFEECCECKTAKLN